MHVHVELPSLCWFTWAKAQDQICQTEHWDVCGRSNSPIHWGSWQQAWPMPQCVKPRPALVNRALTGINNFKVQWTRLMLGRLPQS